MDKSESVHVDGWLDFPYRGNSMTDYWDLIRTSLKNTHLQKISSLLQVFNQLPSRILQRMF